MPRHELNSRVGWAAGSKGTPVAEAPIQCKNVDFGPAEQVTIGANENLIGFPELGNGDVLDRSARISLTMEMKEQSATDVPWVGGALLRACGFAETSAGGSYIGYIYTLSSNLNYVTDGDLDAVDIRINRGNNLTGAVGAQEILKDCLGNVVFTLKNGQRPEAAFNFLGRINSSVATRALSMMTDTAWATSLGSEARPVVVSDCACTVAGVTTKTPEIVLDVGNNVVLRDDIGGDIGGYNVTDIPSRSTAYSVLIEHELLATLNLHTKMIDRTTVAVTGKINRSGSNGAEIQFDFTGRIMNNLGFERVNGILYQRVGLQQAISNSTAAYTNPLAFTWKSAA